MAFRTVTLLSLIILNNSQSSKEIFKTKGVTSGACLRAHRVVILLVICNTYEFASLIPLQRSISIQTRKQQRIGLISNRINGSVFSANFFEKSIWTVLWEKCKFCQVLSGSGYGILVYIHRGSSNVPINWDTNSGKEQIRKIYPDRFLKSLWKFYPNFPEATLFLSG